MELAAPDEELSYIFVIGTNPSRIEIECVDEKFISISYVGWAQYESPGRGNYASMMATTIDCEEMKVLELKDVVSDMNGLSQMLLEHRFEDITARDGISDYFKISNIYGYGGKRDKSYMLLEELNGDDWDIEWYIKERKMLFSEWWSALWGDDVDKALAGKNLVIVSLHFLGAGAAHNEFAIEMRQVQELLREDFVESMLQEGQEESGATEDKVD